jgi:PAS domain S-box-containing protein
MDTSPDSTSRGDQESQVNKLRTLLENSDARARRFEAIAEKMPSLVWIKDREHRLIYCNPAFEEAFGIETGAWLNKSGWDLFPEEQARAIADNDSRVFASNIVLRIVETISFNGIEYHYLSYKFPLNDGPQQYIAGVSIDISTQVETEQRLREEIRSNENIIRTRDRLMSVLAHDVRTPIFTMGQLAELLFEKHHNLSPGELEDNLKGIQTTANSILGTIEQLLTWAKTQQEKIRARHKAITPFRSIEIARGLLAQSAALKEIRIDNKVDPDLRVVGDAELFETVVRNLLSNALKYSPRGGSIRIEQKLEDDYGVISIIDRGRGIDETRLEQIRRGERLKSTPGTEHEAGSGLGLMMCREFIAKQSGTLDVSSEPGKGTRVSVSLPLIDKDSELYQLIYISRCQRNYNATQLRAMADNFREFNQHNHVTGVLAHIPGRFLQIIEGHRLILDSLYEAIGQDSRHSECILLHREPAEHRLFPDWHMDPFRPADGGASAEIQFDEFIACRSSFPDDPVLGLLKSYLSAAMIEA